MKNLKKFGELNEGGLGYENNKTLPPSGTHIKYVADTTDPKTKKILKIIWNSWDEAKRKQMLNKMGHSEKYFDASFEDLTGEIQGKIVMLDASLPENKR